jgi:hypothetical protein
VLNLTAAVILQYMILDGKFVYVLLGGDPRTVALFVCQYKPIVMTASVGWQRGLSN